MGFGVEVIGSLYQDIQNAMTVMISAFSPLLALAVALLLLERLAPYVRKLPLVNTVTKRISGGGSGKGTTAITKNTDGGD